MKAKDKLRELDPTVSLAVVLSLPFSRVSEVKDALAGLPGVKVVLSRMGPPRSLWIRTGEGRL